MNLDVRVVRSLELDDYSDTQMDGELMTLLELYSIDSLPIGGEFLGDFYSQKGEGWNCETQLYSRKYRKDNVTYWVVFRQDNLEECMVIKADSEVEFLSQRVQLSKDFEVEVDNVLYEVSATMSSGVEVFNPITEELAYAKEGVDDLEAFIREEF